jgi:anaerobic magnesium-protoporphyrin IX monomethyl ester cyclase
VNGIKITFLNPPFLKNFSRPQRSPAVTKSGTLYYPMWLAYAAGYAEKFGNEIDVIDAPADDLSAARVIARLENFAPALVVVETSTPSIYADVAFSDQIKKILPEATVLLVGTHVSALAAESLQLGEHFDGAAVGEYDITIKETAEALKHRTSLREVSGLCLREPTGFFFTGKRELNTELDDLPFVSSIYQRFFQVKNYFNPNAIFPMVTITTSRGCPHRCTFCVYPQTMMGHRLRVRSVNNVVDEIEFIVGSFPEVKSIFFEDDTFPANKNRCRQICEEILRRGIQISWTANARADLDYATMRLMKRAGCRCLCVGFESGSQTLLDNIKKNLTVANAHAFMAAAGKAGLLIHGCFIVGHPGETRETMAETLQLALQLKLESVQFYPVMVYPGTEAFTWYQENNLLNSSDFSQWLTPAGLHNTVIRGEQLSSRELVRFCDQARKSFYLRPRYFLYKIKQMITEPQEFRGNLKSARTFFKYLVRGSDVG